MPQGNKQHQRPVVPSVRVKLINDVRLPPRHAAEVTIQLEGNNKLRGPVLIESDSDYLPAGISFSELLIVTSDKRQTN